jgi:hypothetical protein
MVPDHDARDDAVAALVDLRTEIDRSLEHLQHARGRIDRLIAERAAGRPWLEVVTAEERPLVVESISAVLSGLARAGHVWRREQAVALRREDVSINRIAALFGVTRQRISTLLREADQTS